MDRFIIRTKKSTSCAKDDENKISALSESSSLRDAPVQAEETERRDLRESETTQIFKKGFDGEEAGQRKHKCRKYSDRWKETYKWIYFDKEMDKVFCDICRKCAELNIFRQNLSRSEQSSLTAFVHEGFSNWKKAIAKFKSHETSAIHKSSLEKYGALISGKTIHKHLSRSKEKEMMQSRIALKAIISSLQYLAVQGLAIRGHTDELSNFMSLLKLRSEDVPELENWLKRTKYKWCSHDILNEILSILSRNIQLQLVKFIKQAKYYAIMLDETTDISSNEQISICVRVVDENLETQEIFIGFYETDLTDAKTLFSITMDVLIRLDVSIQDCRGQCYDGASNVSGEKTGLQQRIKEREKRAIFIHCMAHSMNLVVQDGMQQVTEMRNFLSIVKDIINFVSKSPKRIAMFKHLKLDMESESGFLRPFCPTRWTLRVSSLKTVVNNYSVLLEFLQNIAAVDKTEAGAKASGFFKTLMKYDSYFYLTVLISIFEKIEIVNTELQTSAINFQDAKLKIEGVKSVIRSLRQNGFDKLWQYAEKEANFLKLEAPKLLRQRKIPRRIETSDGHKFGTSLEYHRKVFYEVVDTVIQSLNDRFQNTVMDHIINMENFVLKKTNADFLCQFYGDDFDKERLLTHRNMLWDLASTENFKLKSVMDVCRFF